MTGNPSVGAEARSSGTHGAVEILPSLDRNKLQQTLEARNMRQQKQRTHKEERRTSIFKSLDILDVDANDVDYSAAHNYQSAPPKPSRGRYLRRGSVVRTKIEADSGGMQPTEVSGGNESDYGSDYDSTYGSDYDSGVDSDADTGSLCSQGSENAQQRRQRHHRRYLRRGSVTKYSLDASVGDKVVGMQPASAAEEAVRSVRDGRTSRLPPPPSNSFREEKNETDYGFGQNNLGVAGDAVDIDGEKKSAGSAKKPPLDTKRRPRRSRRGSMRMPGDDGTVRDPLPGHELYSGNLDDSGHHRRNVYFDSTEAFQAHPQRDMASALTSAVGASSTNRQSARLHPLERSSGQGPPRSFIDPQKTPSGRNLMVDETEMFRNDLDVDDDDDGSYNKDYCGQLETIGSVSTPSSMNDMHGGFVRRESNSSVGSDSSSEFASEDFSAGDSDFKIPAAKQTPKKAASVKLPPKLPPSYSSKPKSVKRVPPPPPRRRNGMKIQEDDSTSSSTRSEEEDGSENPATASTFSGIKAVPRPAKTTKSKKPVRKGSGTSASFSSSSATMKTKQRRSSTCVAYAQTRTPAIKGCLRREGQRSSTLKGVRFGNIVITEFPIILGDNPAVTSGAPVTIDWTPQAENSYSVNAFEQFKPARRRRRKLLISVSSRAILLLAAGYSVDEIADASINAQQIKHERQVTLHANQNWDRVSLLMENTNDAVTGMVQPLTGLVQGTNGALTGMMQNTGKKLKALIPKPVKHSETARTA